MLRRADPRGQLVRAAPGPCFRQGCGSAERPATYARAVQGSSSGRREAAGPAGGGGSSGQGCPSQTGAFVSGSSEGSGTRQGIREGRAEKGRGACKGSAG